MPRPVTMASIVSQGQFNSNNSFQMGDTDCLELLYCHAIKSRIHHFKIVNRIELTCTRRQALWPISSWQACSPWAPWEPVPWVAGVSGSMTLCGTSEGSPSICWGTRVTTIPYSKIRKWPCWLLDLLTVNCFVPLPQWKKCKLDWSVIYFFNVMQSVFDMNSLTWTRRLTPWPYSCWQTCLAWTPWEPVPYITCVIGCVSLCGASVASRTICEHVRDTTIP